MAMKIGSHVGMKAPEYLVGSVKEMLSYHANAMMIYTGAPQNTKRVDCEQLKIAEATSLLQENGLDWSSVIVHAPYIINLGNVHSDSIYQLGIDFLTKEIERTKTIGASVLVLHPGSSVKATAEEGIQRIISGLNAVLHEDEGVYIALETMAGKGSEVGRSLEELRQIMDGVTHNQWLKVCLDTCHLHDAGYDMKEFDAFLDLFDTIIGLDKIACIHINDSKNVQGAHKDRHENIGYGEIGFATLNAIVHHPKLENTIKILETPYMGDDAPYAYEIENFRKQEFVAFKK